MLQKLFFIIKVSSTAGYSMPEWKTTKRHFSFSFELCVFLTRRVWAVTAVHLVYNYNRLLPGFKYNQVPLHTQTLATIADTDNGDSDDNNTPLSTMGLLWDARWIFEACLYTSFVRRQCAHSWYDWQCQLLQPQWQQQSSRTDTYRIYRQVARHSPRETCYPPTTRLILCSFASSKLPNVLSQACPSNIDRQWCGEQRGIGPVYRHVLARAYRGGLLIRRGHKFEEKITVRIETCNDWLWRNYKLWTRALLNITADMQHWTIVLFASCDEE